MLNKKPILITGSHRSGSTWVGRMIGFSPDVFYVHEPFNIQHRNVGICSVDFKYWFPYINEKNSNLFDKELLRTFSLTYNLKQKMSECFSLAEVFKVIKEFIRVFAAKQSNKRPLFKDPFALFSSKWLSEQFDFDIVVIIRHPAAFVGSLKKANWDFPFSHFLDQHQLMEDYLKNYKNQLLEYSNDKKDIVDQGILLWNIIHHVIYHFMKMKTNWMFVRHEDISLDPLNSFQRIYQHLNLDFTDTIKNDVKYHCLIEGNFDNVGRHCIKRNSKQNILSWKKRLTEEEISKIKSQTKDISEKFYTEADW